MYAIDYRNRNSAELQWKASFFQTTPAKLPNILTLPFSLYQALPRGKPDLILASGDSQIVFMLAYRQKTNVPLALMVDYYRIKGNRIPRNENHVRYAVSEGRYGPLGQRPMLSRLACLNDNRCWSKLA